MDDKDTALVSVAGVIEAKKVGKTTLYARSVGYDKNGNSVVLSEVCCRNFYLFHKNAEHLCTLVENWTIHYLLNNKNFCFIA